MRKTEVDREWLRREYVDRQRTCAAIADDLGVRSQTISKWLRAFGIQSRRTGPPSGLRHPGWKGGKTVDKAGYILVYQPQHPFANSNGYIREHRLVAENMTGRHLSPNEVVHHADGNPSNNDPANLVVFDSNGRHLHHERSGLRPNWSKRGLAVIRAPIVQNNASELIADYRSSMPLWQVAAKHGLSESGVRARMKRYGVALRQQGNRYTSAQRQQNRLQKPLAQKSKYPRGKRRDAEACNTE